MVLPSAGHARDVQPALGELRRVTGEERAGGRVEQLVPGEPDLPSVLRVPVPLGELDLDDQGYRKERILIERPLFGAYCWLSTPVQIRYVPPRLTLWFFE